MNSVTLVAARGGDVRAYTIVERFVAFLTTIDGHTQAWGQWFPSRGGAELYLITEANHLDATGWEMDLPIYRNLDSGDIAALTLLDPVKPSHLNPSMHALMMGES